ncbi:AlpA family phage regulatory protein [Comamonas testosteroni]|jgi:prophage regulatory protein|uniref:AlpA family phage regulatory protein n=1 Tax=Comamonas testosteroni TaxID=285 RepID=UPI00265D7B5F|nr:AlpA family phage regulatory protein [Comamonas testosteroni]WKL15318.1 AlpA family phage regulatory protein [Comamonas testosteroni]WQD41227.1 AlpA family phage regulatory protein [Comamonas testosteroni]
MSSESTSRFNKHVISMDEVLERTALSRSMLYKLLRQDKFPHPTPMSNRSVGWFEVDIENWLQTKTATRQANLTLPLIYMAGQMGTAEGNRKQDSDIHCWRIFDVSKSNTLGEPGAEDILISPPQEMVFHGTRTRFMYSGPWKAQETRHGYMHEATSASLDKTRNATYRGALQGISRADVVVAYLEDLQAYGTLVEVGYARAAGKRVIVITSPALHKPPLNNGWGRGLWVAIRAADRHIELPDQPGSTSEDHWRLAHAHAAMTIAEWYPNTVVNIS